MQRPTRIREFDDGCDRWRMIDAMPDRALGGSVHGYGWWSEATASFDTRRELAGTQGTLIVNLASDLDLVDAGGRRVRLRAGEGFVAGLARRTSMSRSTGPMEGVHLRAPLSTLARLAGTSIAALTDRVVPIADLPGLDRLRLAERLLDAADMDARWAVLDRVVSQAMAASGRVSASIDHISGALAGGMRVEAVAEELGWSRKRLARTFRDEVGLEPRGFVGLARFERFAAMLQAEPDVSLAEAAIAAGYADQSHLTREVARYADATPGALRRRVLPAEGGVRD